MNLSQEMWLEARLRESGVKCNAFEGATNEASRRDHFRGVITNHGLADVKVGNAAFTFAQAFQSTYGDAL